MFAVLWTGHVAEFGSRATVIKADIASLALDHTFDAATMMFSVLGYHVTDKDLFGALDAVRRHLRPGGLLVFDVLDGAVAGSQPGPTRRMVALVLGAL